MRKIVNGNKNLSVLHMRSVVRHDTHNVISVEF